MSLPAKDCSQKLTMLVMAGGTGGHIFPGLAVADELRALGWNIHWLGTADKMEANIVPEHGYSISFINISGLRNKGIKSLLFMPFKLIQSLFQARRIIKNINPNVVLGMGGYASAPGGVAAWLNKTPLIIHEQNAAAGLSNRLLAKIANTVCCAFPDTFANTVDAKVVGNPLRASISQDTKKAKQETTQQKFRKNILVVGGSLGAQILNEIMPSCFTSLVATDNKVAIWHQTGAAKQVEVEAAYKVEDIESTKVKVTPFIKDMAEAYQWADVVVCRAGALTVSELAMAGKPAIFVPLPHAVDDHQTKNALYLVNQGAAKLLPQSQLTSQNITGLINELFSDCDSLSKMAKAAKNAANQNASKQVAKLCQQLIKN
jgi:UDP-N-acetylglucosamine--N-acetylmuramyl-(pentapeptide) pyrophosphoryl-undecaprenol N-acetylglucosamine transferase